MQKYIFITAAILSTSLINANAATKNSNLSVSAKMASGCFITATNMNFGVVTGPGQTSSATMALRCSKNTQVSIIGSAKNNPGAVYGPRMWRVGATTDKHETRMRYGIDTSSIVSNTEVQVVKQAKDSYLWNNSGAGYDYNLVIRLLTGESTTFQIKGFIDPTSIGINVNDSPKPFKASELLPGAFYDEFTYNLTF
jgi:hypothetical protein